MSKTEQIDKRGAALRDNLKRRKLKVKTAKAEKKQETEKNPKKNKDA